MNQLIKEYDANMKRVNELAVNSVINIQIPVVNTLSSLSRHTLIQLLHNIKHKFKNVSASQQSFFLTLLTDVLTCMIKYNDFYGTFVGNNSYIVQLLCDKLQHLAKIKKEELNQIIKYANRIPDYPELKRCLTEIQSFNNNRNNFSHKHQEDSKSDTNLQTINNNTIIDKPATFLTTKGMYVGENKLNDLKKNIDNTNTTNSCNLQLDNNEIHPYNVEVKFVQNKIKLVKVPEKKPITKFETKTNVNSQKIRRKSNLTEINSIKLAEIKCNVGLSPLKPIVNLTEGKLNVNLTDVKLNVNLTETKLNINSTEIPKELEKGKRRNAFEVLMNAARNKKMKLF